MLAGVSPVAGVAAPVALAANVKDPGVKVSDPPPGALPTTGNCTVHGVPAFTCGTDTLIVELPGFAVKLTIGAEGVLDVHPASVSVTGLSSTTPAGSVSVKVTLKTVSPVPGAVIVYWTELEPVTAIRFGVNDVASVGGSGGSGRGRAREREHPDDGQRL